MTTRTADQALRRRGSRLPATGRQKIGTVEEIHLDSETRAPEWALVHTGLFGAERSLWPRATPTRPTFAGDRAQRPQLRIAE